MPCPSSFSDLGSRDYLDSSDEMKTSEQLRTTWAETRAVDCLDNRLQEASALWLHSRMIRLSSSDSEVTNCHDDGTSSSVEHFGSIDVRPLSSASLAFTVLHIIKIIAAFKLAVNRWIGSTCILERNSQHLDKPGCHRDENSPAKALPYSTHGPV